jgi:hypothetical protein
VNDEWCVGYIKKGRTYTVREFKNNSVYRDPATGHRRGVKLEEVPGEISVFFPSRFEMLEEE